MILGLPHLNDGPLLHAARRLGATVLLSVNAFSRYRTDPATGVREWIGFNRRPLGRADGIPICLDSAGFVAMKRYRGFEWSVDDYMDFAACYPFRWAASMDLCVEPEIAADRDAVLDRVAGTVALNRQCRRAARDRGVEARLMPVIQGWAGADYRRCIDMMPEVADAPLIGVGSMCRRHVGGPLGAIAIVDAIDRHFGPGQGPRLHLFGLKSDGAAALRGHPRCVTTDSQAYGIRARRLAGEQGISKSNVFLSRVMSEWWLRQSERLAADGWQIEFTSPQPDLDIPEPLPAAAFDRSMARAWDEMRELVAAGEADFTSDMHPARAAAWAAMIAEDEQEEPQERDAPEADPGHIAAELADDRWEPEQAAEWRPRM